MSMPKREQTANIATTTLNGAINNSTTTVVVTDGSVFPSVGNFRVMVDDEIMICTARSTNTLTVSRGQDGTTGASHSDLAPIGMIFSAEGYYRLQRDSDALWGYASRPPIHGVYDAAGTGRLVATDFTWVNQGGASVNDNGDSITLRCPTDSGTELRMLALTPGGGSWTYVAAMRAMAGGDGGCFPHCGLGMRESGTGKVITFGAGGSNFKRNRWSMGKWTASGTLSGGNFQFDRNAMQSLIRHWFKVEYNGTNVKVFGSGDGFEWIEYLSESKTTFFTTAPDQVVWFGSNIINSGGLATELVVSLDHFHKE